MAEYNHREIEKKWQKYWEENQTYKVEADPSRPKYYVLDMFPYPSGAGLHVGHPLGYIASDIFSRYKRLKGYNVLHPMGFDSFGLPAEQYAIQTGQHPAVTTEQNIRTYISQLKNIGFSYDWSREVRTSDPEYYKWTQWIDLLGFFGSRELGLLYGLLDVARCLGFRLLLQGLHQLFLGLFRRKIGDLLQLNHLLLMHFLGFLPFLGGHFDLLVHLAGFRVQLIFQALVLFDLL